MGRSLLLLAAVSLAAPAFAADPPPAPFLKVDLNAASFRGADPAATRKRVDAFAAALGRKVQAYQDNDALLAVKVTALIEPASGGLAALQRTLLRTSFSRSLRGLGLGEVEARGDDWQVILKPNLYPENVRERLKALPEASIISFHENKAMSGQIWLQLSVDGLRDPEGFAARVAREHPREVRSAAIMISVPVATFSTAAP
jgi:hypothetical protein